MAVGYVIADADGPAQDLATLAAALDAELNITAVATEIGTTAADPGGVINEARLKVTGTAGVDITNAITAVGNCQLEPGTVIV